MGHGPPYLIFQDLGKVLLSYERRANSKTFQGGDWLRGGNWDVYTTAASPPPSPHPQLCSLWGVVLLERSAWLRGSCRDGFHLWRRAGVRRPARLW